MPPQPLVVGLGSNVGSREALLRAACDLLGRADGLSLAARSSLYDTAPVGPAQPRYLNAAALVRSGRPPAEVFESLLAVERALGRVRTTRWGPRTADLDLLWCEGEAVSAPSLTVPHGELLHREFALRPLLEVAPGAVDPRDGAPLARALAALAPDPTLRAAPFEESFPCELLAHTADEGFVTLARDRADLLAAAAECVGSLIVDPRTVAPTRAVDVEVAVDDEAGDDGRMFAWLAEVLYHLDAGRLALRRAVVFEDGEGAVRGRLFGEDLDEARHGVRTALKAVTWHALEVGPLGDGTWRAQVVMDV
ncbi:MAG: 2-amino-4-hydroxy-6-hydroxymethyldihydropteridine diphosphokinase [Polyangiales bacterium]